MSEGHYNVERNPYTKCSYPFSHKLKIDMTKHIFLFFKQSLNNETEATDNGHTTVKKI